MKMIKFPQFGAYVCVGDSIEWKKEGFDIVATVEADNGTHINDYDCYSPIKIKQWKNGEWFFVGVVLSVSKNGIEIEDHAASLWGIECNYNKTANRYLSEVVQELEGEAIESAKNRVAEICKAICA